MLAFNDVPTDHNQIENFFAQYYDGLFRYALYLTSGDAQRASDAVIESFTKIIERYDRFRDFSDIRLFSYMISVLKNYVYDQQRKEKRLLFFESLDETPDSDIDFLESEIQKIDEEILRESVSSLSAHDQAVLKLKYYNEANNSEIGYMLGIKPESVRCIVSRALRRLKAVYLKKGND